MDSGESDELGGNMQQDVVEKTDFELINITLGGKTEAFGILVQRYRRPLVGLSFMYVKDQGHAEDVAQEAFLKAFEKLGTFQFRSSFKSWLFRIAINTAKNRLRKKRPMIDHEKVVLLEEARAEKDLLENELKDQLRLEIEKLPAKQKKAMKLRIYGDLSFQEVANKMKCPYDTAKANYRHGLMKLRQGFVS